jgi:hypothetical protein
VCVCVWCQEVSVGASGLPLCVCVYIFRMLQLQDAGLASRLLRRVLAIFVNTCRGLPSPALATCTTSADPSLC